MPSPAAGYNDDKMAAASRQREDYLDWLENQSRSSEDCREVDHRFLGGSIAITSMWLIALMIWLGSISGLAVAGYCLVTHHHFGAH